MLATFLKKVDEAHWRITHTVNMLMSKFMSLQTLRDETVLVVCLTTLWVCVISGFRREVDENCAILGCYAASIGNFLLTFRDNLQVPSSRDKDSCPLKMGPDRLSRNFGKKYTTTRCVIA